MSAPLLSLRDIRLTFGGTPLLAGAEMIVSPGERLCLVGRNGSGKSTFLKVAAGLIEADGGERILQAGTTLRYLPQEPELGGFATTLDYVLAGLAPADDPHRAHRLLAALGMTGDEPTASLSGGERRRAALARTIAPEPDILLLDEPTNHLDLPAIEWLEGELMQSRSALVVISHDRRFLEHLTRQTLWLDQGQVRRLNRGFGAFEAWRDEVLEQEERERHKLDRKIVAELDWLRYGVTARRKRNVRRLENLHALRKERRDDRPRGGEVQFGRAQGAAGGKLVIEARHLSKGFGARPIVQGLDLRVMQKDRLAIVGPNGAGKSTLLKLLMGDLQPDEGTVRLGANLEPVVLDQNRQDLTPGMTVAEFLTGGGGDQVIAGGKARHVVSYMKDFLFPPEQARTPVDVLSGGERGRLLLARALAQASNLLVLDEPTNDLDIETLDLLQEMLNDYLGTILLVSHDRDFIDRVASTVLAFEGGGRWTEYAGGYSDMVAQRGHGVLARQAEAAAPPRAAAPPARAAPPPVQKRKLSFKDKHALETLPARMTALEKEIAGLHAQLQDQKLFARDPARFQEAAARLAAAQHELAQAEEDWLRLEMLREEVEGA